MMLSAQEVNMGQLMTSSSLILCLADAWGGIGVPGLINQRNKRVLHHWISQGSLLNVHSQDASMAVMNMSCLSHRGG